MPLPVTFATLPTGLNPMALFDQNFEYLLDNQTKATQEEAVAGANTTAVMSPLNVAQAAAGYILGTRAEYIAADLPLILVAVTTTGYAAATDGGGATYARVETEPLHAGKFQSHDGAWWELSNRVVTPEMFGAVGDGSTLDTIAITNALTVGQQICGAPGRVYAVAGNIMLPANAYMVDCSFKQMTPGGGNRRTLFASNVNNIRLYSVTVDRNGDGTNGALGDDAGIWITGGSGHVLMDLVVHGWDMGSGLVIANATNFNLINPRVYDIKYTLATNPGDDRVQGIWLTGCSYFNFIGYNVSDLGGTIASISTTRWSRALPMGGCSDFLVYGGRVFDVDQGVDMTGGGDGNRRFVISICVSTRCRSYGFKFANSPYEGNITSCTGVDCGLATFVVSGPVETGLPSPRDLTFTSCRSINVGSNGEWLANFPTGFLVTQGTFDTNRPRPVRFVNCDAVDNQTVPTMAYGFRNQVVAPTYGIPFNECVDCTSFGHTIAAFYGFNYPAVKVNRTANLTLTNGATTDVLWTAEVYDGANMHDNSSNRELIRVPRDGWYRCVAKITFAGNASGTRFIVLNVSGNQDAFSLVRGGGNANDQTFVTEATYYLTTNNNVKVQAFQSSGGNLDIVYQYSSFEVTEAMNQNAAP